LLLRLGGLGPGLEHVLLRARLSNLSLKGDEALLEGLHLSLLRLHLTAEGGGGFLKGLAAGESFPSQILLVFLQGKLCPLVPGARLGLGLVGLAAETLLTGDRHGHRLSKLHQIGLHVRDRLIEDLDGVLHAADCSIGVRANQTTQPIKETHGSGQAVARG